MLASFSNVCIKQHIFQINQRLRVNGVTDFSVEVMVFRNIMGGQGEGSSGSG